MNEMMIITKVQRLENENNKQWREYPIGVEGAYTYIRNGNGKAKTAQSLLMKELEPQTYIYGQPIWDANNQVLESLTWENIQKWLNKDRINDFLKEGDCIEVTTDIDTNPAPNEEEYKKYHFYIIGINRHNGQTSEELELDHIDFCGGSMVQLGRRFVNNNSLNESGQPGETEYNFAYMPSNNGGEEDIEHNGTYGNYFVDGIFSINSGVTPIQCLNEICNSSNMHIANKKLYLDARFRPHLSFLNAWASQKLNGTVDELINDLATIWRNIQTAVAEDPTEGWYPTLRSGFKDQGGILDTYPITAGIAQQALRVNVGLAIDDFLIDAGCALEGGFALSLLRYSVGVEDLPDDTEMMGSAVLREALVDYFYNLCETAAKWSTVNGGSYSVVSKKSNNYPSSSIWGLTEKELFGECTFSNAEYAQGQIFQYPIFNDLSYRKKITQDLSLSSDNVCYMTTLTPVENSNTKVAGMDPETLMPIEASILKTNTYIPDMPICFRIQEERFIALQNQGGE